MTTAPPEIPLHIGDYLRDTLHLKPIDHAAYLLLLMHCWALAGALPNDEEILRKITGLTIQQWRRTWPRIRPFFTLEDYQKWTQKRISADLAKALKYREAQSARAKRRLVYKKEDRSSLTERDSKTGNGAALTASPHLAAVLKRKGFVP